MFKYGQKGLLERPSDADNELGMAAVNGETPDVWRLFELTRAGEWEGLEAYLNRMLALCSELFGASGASIFLGHEGSEEFDLAGTSGTLSRVPMGAKLRRGSGIAGTAIRNEKPMLVLDPSRFPGMTSGKFQRREDIGSSMVIPLLTPLAGCFGVLNLARETGTPDFSEVDLARAESIASQVALAVSNARLFVKTNMATADLRTTNEKLQSVVSSVGVGLIVVNRLGKITDCNPIAQELVGVFTGDQDLQHYLTGAPKYLKGILESAIQSANSGQRATHQAFDEMSGRYWSIVATPMESGGVTVAIQEVTEHEVARREVSRLERLAEIGQMTATIAHEIRNPLTGIRSAAQIVQSSPESAHELGKIIEVEAIKLNGLCDEFLEFSRPIVISAEEFDLGSSILSVVESERRSFEESEVQLKVEMAGAPCWVVGDPSKTEQVCRNLLRNAREACNPGAQVIVRVYPDGFEVEDTGLGMDDETKRKLFTPFFTTKSHGTGLGLSSVRKIVDAMGAQIRVHSAPDKGTLFQLQFEVRKAA